MRIKHIARNDAETIRPFPEAMSTYKYIFGALQLNDLKSQVPETKQNEASTDPSGCPEKTEFKYTDQNSIRW